MAESLDKVQQIVESQPPFSEWTWEQIAARQRQLDTERAEHARIKKRAYSYNYTEKNMRRERARYGSDEEFRRRRIAQVRRHQLMRPLAHKARAMIGDKVRKGLIPAPSSFACADCGKKAREYDHRDYTKPLEVEPVCHPCNVRRGPGYPYNR